VIDVDKSDGDECHHQNELDDPGYGRAEK
jgi:hypothetical protein